MGNYPVSRRSFFRSIRTPQLPVDTEDKLFKKYARKSTGPRVYKTNLIAYREKETNNTAARTGNITSGLTPYTGVWDESAAMHLLRRTGYGFEKAQVDTLMTLTPSVAVDTILTIDSPSPAPPVNWYNNISPDENGLPYGADWTNDPFNSNIIGQTTNINRSVGLGSWLLGLAFNQDMNIREKMVWFWYHFIPVDFLTILQSSNIYIGTNSARVCYQYIKMFRDNALGNFKEIITNVATQPAMMFYLNNQENTATAPDENFARELMELFTLGKDPLSQYTQDDVVAAAKVLTGWRVENLNTLATTTNFVSADHNTEDKNFSSFFNNTVIANAGATELNSLIDMIFSKSQVVSEYICRRLYRYFIYYDIDDNIEANVITPLAQTFVASNWDILPVLQQLFKSEHFFDLANRGVYIKSPLDVVVGTLRQFNINYSVADQSNYEAQYDLWIYYSQTACLPLNQQMGTVPNVSGWPPFYQTPAYHEYWINANTIQKRFALLQSLFFGYTLTNNGLSTIIRVDNIAFIQQFDNTICQDPNLLVAECIKYLLPVNLSTDQQASIKLQTLLNQQVNDSYWTSAWNNYLSDPTNTSYKNTVNIRLKNLLFTLTELAEFQLM